MKKLYFIMTMLIVILTLQSCIVSSRPSIDYFKNKEIRNNHEFVSVNIPTFLTKFVIKSKLKSDGESKEVIQLVKKFSKIKIMTTSSLNDATVKGYNTYLESKKFEEWATIKNDGNLITIKAKQNEDVIKNLILVVSSSNSSSVFIDIKGKFTPDDISQLINAANNDKIDFNFSKS